MSCLAVVEQVMYPYHSIINHDEETGEDKILVVVLMPSGQYGNKIDVKFTTKAEK